VTDLDGKFSISNVPSSAKILVVSYVGMHSQEVNIQPIVRIVLESSFQTLDDVVVVAYGTAKKSSLTGAISTVSAEKIEKRPVSNVAAALEGAAPGVQVNSSYGEPGRESKIRIRGIGSVNGSMDPLYVVDGAIYNGSINDLNPQDIESISVLKDAASAALYGNRAANGVILITTRSGKSEQARIRINVNQGIFKRAMPEYDKLGADDWMEVMWKGYRNSLMTSAPSRYPTTDIANAEASNSLISDVVKYNIYNKSNSELFTENGKLVAGAKILDGIAGDLDWFEPIERTGYRQEYAISGNGSSEKSNYYFSASYLDEDGYLKSSDYQRFTGRANVNITPVNWFKAGVNISGSHHKMNFASGDPDDTSSYTTHYINPFYYSRFMAPVYPVHLHDLETGDYILDANKQKQYDSGATYARAQNLNRHIVWETELDRNRRYRTSLLGQVFADVKFLNDFTLSLKGDLNTWNEERQVYNNAIIGDGAGSGRASRTIYRYKTYTFQQQLNWNRSFGAHNIDFLVGHENYSYLRSYTYAFKTNEILPNNPVLSNFTVTSSLDNYEYDYKTESYLSRLRYNYDDKYFAEASFRRDGSSRFHKDNRWGNFWSIGGSWMISHEDFMESVADQINSLKLRASYGEVGNDQGVGYYGYMTLLYLNQNGNEGAVYKLQNEAKDIKWETTSSFGVALEGRLFNRANFSVEYFDKRAQDLLFDVYLPLSAGGTSTDNAESTVTRNLGTISNRGWEISLDGDIIRNRDWRWNVGANITVQKNKVVSLPEQNKDGIISGAHRIMEGKSRYEFWSYQFAGVDQMTGMSLYLPNLEDYSLETIPSQYLVEINGKEYTTLTTYAKRDWSGSAIPKVFGSISSSLDWKNFTLSLLCTYSAGNKVHDSAYYSLMSVSSSPSAIHKDILKAWDGVPEGMTETSPNRIDPNGVPVVDYSIQSSYGASNSTRFLQNGSYFVIKNIALAYNLPRTFTSRMSLVGATVNAAVENVATFTALKGMNPQQQYNGMLYNAYVPSRVFSVGISINL
ncbi:MAG: SusC/RagA family TonB-linked outer membrane protein, partial [Tannerellaceae bacterium]|nr:SusC/RagA family TonB-linked outer membrane protein [Tannerellaceae bacterium]